MCDFLTSIPFFDEQPAIKRLIAQGIITIICIVLCMLKDPSLLVTISSFGLAALIISFTVLLGYGFTTSHLEFHDRYLWPTNTRDILNNLGIFVYSLAFTEYVLPQAVLPSFHWFICRSMLRRCTNTVSLRLYPLQ